MTLMTSLKNEDLPKKNEDLQKNREEKEDRGYP